jgi:phage gp46-like protein
MTLGLILDIALIALIGAAAVGGVVLNAKLKKLALAQSELRSALDTFSEAAAKADDALKRIESAGVIKGAELQAAAARAQKLATDLSVMTAAGERVATRIEDALRDVRAVGAKRQDRRAA